MFKKMADRYMRKKYGNYCFLDDKTVWFAERAQPAYNHTFLYKKYGNLYRLYYNNGILVGIRKVK